MFIPELTTRITVEIDTTGLDNALNLIESSDVLSDLTSLTDEINDRKNKLLDLRAPLGEAVADALSSNQENIISSKHYLTGMMSNSVDVMNDGEDFLVGNTASSIDGFPYPLAIEKGSRDHWIAPATFRALHWEDSSGEHWSKGHMVSGITADPFVEPSIEDTIYQIESILDEVM